MKFIRILRYCFSFKNLSDSLHFLYTKASSWIEKIKIRAKLPPSEQSVQAGDGAIGELVKLFDELASQPELLRGLSDELVDLNKKIPKELKKELQENPDGIGLDDIEWLGSLVEQVRPMLIRMLMRKGDFE